MIQVQGDKDTQIMEVLSHDNYTLAVRWNFQPEGDNLVNYKEDYFYQRPTIEQIEGMILNGINAEVDKNILSGYYWKDMLVWLSAENQSNYKGALDLATQMPELVLPVTIKLGTTENPEYYTFTELQEFQQFYVGAFAHIQRCLSEGWAKKDSFDFEPYKELINKI